MDARRGGARDDDDDATIALAASAPGDRRHRAAGDSTLAARRAGSRGATRRRDRAAVDAIAGGARRATPRAVAVAVAIARDNYNSSSDRLCLSVSYRLAPRVRGRRLARDRTRALHARDERAARRSMRSIRLAMLARVSFWETRELAR